MNPETWDEIIRWLPWAALGVVLWILIAQAVEGFRKKCQAASHVAAKIGFVRMEELLDAISRGDKPAIARCVEKLVEEYGSEKGVLKFAYDVFDESIDDLMDDPNYADRVGKRLEEVILGTIISPEQQIALGGVAANFGKLSLKSAQNFFQGLATGKIGPVRDAIRDIVSRFSNPDHVDDEIVKLAPGVVADVKKNHPELVPALRAALLSSEEAAKLVA
jgi:hypothetical protein